GIGRGVASVETAAAESARHGGVPEQPFSEQVLEPQPRGYVVPAIVDGAWWACEGAFQIAEQCLFLVRVARTESRGETVRKTIRSLPEGGRALGLLRNEEFDAESPGHAHELS